MKIKFTDSVAGANFAYQMGETHDLRPDLAKPFVRAGQAIKVEDEPEGLLSGVRRKLRGGKTAELGVDEAREQRA